MEGLGLHENQLDESEFDLNAVARELEMPVDPGNNALSIGQYCIDMLMIMKVTIVG